MAILQTSAKVLTKRLPKVISPTAHAVIDYVSAATFFAVGALYFRRNKRAAISAIICGAAETVTSLLTDYPGGVADMISFPSHGKIDVGLAAMTAALPEFMDFSDERENALFRNQALVKTIATGLTDFGRGRNYDEAFEREAA